MFLFYLAVFVLGIIMFFLFLRKWSDGEMSGVETIGGAFAILILLACLITPIPLNRLIAAGLIIGSFIFITTESKIRGAIMIREMLQEDLDQATQVVELDPSNIGARVTIAKSLYKMGRTESAIEHMRAAMQLEGAGYFREEKSRLEDWEQDRDSRLGRGEVLCPKCKTPNRRGARVCKKCEFWLRTSDEIADWLRRGGLKTILRVWIVASVVVTMMLFAMSFLSFKGFILVFLLTAIVLLIWLLVHIHSS